MQAGVVDNQQGHADDKRRHLSHQTRVIPPLAAFGVQEPQNNQGGVFH